MRTIKNKNKSNKTIIRFLVILFSCVVILALIFFYIIQPTLPKKADESINGGNAFTKGVDAPHEANNEDSEAGKSKDSENQDNKKLNSKPETETDNYVKPPIAGDTKSEVKNVSFPIITDRYKIDKKSESSYKITLYPIVNNPNYANYKEQLRDYKNEATQRLKDSTDTAQTPSIEWVPSEVNNV